MKERLVQIMADENQEMILHITSEELTDSKIKELYISYVNSEVEDFEEYLEAENIEGIERVYTEEVYV